MMENPIYKELLTWERSFTANFENVRVATAKKLPVVLQYILAKGYRPDDSDLTLQLKMEILLLSRFFQRN